MTGNSKTAGRRAKLGEMSDSEVVLTCTLGTFDLLMFRVIFGSFSALVSKWH